ncbi:MAG: hypothetical protein ACOY0T_30895 [Myxococcota bacterium]
MSDTLHVARIAAAFAFILVLAVLAICFVRTKRQAEREEIELALEADFERLERQLGPAAGDPLLPGKGS